MGDSKCALDDCRRPPSKDSQFCYFHRSPNSIHRKKDLTAAAETIFPTSGKYRFIRCSFPGFHKGVARIRYEVEPAHFGGYNPYSGKYKSSYYFEAKTDTIEINEINLKDLSQIKAEMRSALANLRRADRKMAEWERKRYSSPSAAGRRTGRVSSRKNRWLPSNDDDINSVDGGPPSEASDDDG